MCSEHPNLDRVTSPGALRDLFAGQRASVIFLVLGRVLLPRQIWPRGRQPRGFRQFFNHLGLQPHIGGNRMAVDFEGDGGGSEPIELARGLCFSISRLAEGLGMARETVSKRFREAGVPSSGVRNGYPVYSLRDALPVLFPSGIVDGVLDPKTLPPVERSAWFQSELKRLDVEARARELIPSEAHYAGLATMANDIVQFLERLPERLAEGLSPEQAAEMRLRIKQQCDTFRTNLDPDRNPTPAEHR